MIRTPYGINSERNYTPSQPVRDPEYLKFIRRLPCVACGRSWRIEAAHFGPHGMSQKSSDLQTLPLCYQCHRLGSKAYHQVGAKEFAILHNIDVESLITLFNHFYQTKLKKGAA